MLLVAEREVILRFDILLVCCQVRVRLNKIQKSAWDGTHADNTGTGNTQSVQVSDFYLLHSGFFKLGFINGTSVRLNLSWIWKNFKLICQLETVFIIEEYSLLILEIYCNSPRKN